MLNEKIIILPVVIVFLVVYIGVDECTEEGNEKPGGACEIGLAQCGSSLEVCRPIKRNNRSRTGACYCKEGYVRSKPEEQCQSAGGSIGTTSSSTKAGTGQQENNGGSTMVAVKIMGPANVQLPVNQANLSADVEPGKNESIDLKYAWIVKSSPSGGGGPVILEGYENRTVRVTKLREGRYVFGVRVTTTSGENGTTGEATWAMNVLAERKPKNAPIAIVKPPVETVNEKAQVILDGSNSKDPDEGGTIMSYLWTQVAGPTKTSSKEKSDDKNVLASTPTLTLSNLPPGNYTFKLTVKDKEGLENSALARVYVKPEIDYSPKAIAGSCDGTSGDVLVRLPAEAVYLCGNMSTDDKAITKWTWTLKEADKNTADMEGTGSSILKVSNLHAGDYTFHLVVEDEKGQSSSEDVHVVVMPAVNKPPTAEAGQNQTIKFPESSAILDGALSSDDKRIVSYSWSQIEGPSKAVLTNADQARMTATELQQQGGYVFQLNVTDDEGQWDVDQAVVIVDASDNRPPTPIAEDVSVTLPCNMASLDGSSSKDDAGIVRWLWTVQEENVAGLELLGSTWQQPILLVSNLAVGSYVFNLTVFDKQGAAASKLVKLNVAQSDKEKQTVEIYLGVKYSEFTIRHKKKLEKQLQSLLETNPIWDRVSVDITKIFQDPRDGSVYILFYSQLNSFDSKSPQSILPASVVAEFLQVHWSRSAEFMSDFSVNRIDTLYCHNNCSGRGRCQEFTKRCVCDRYWMPNLFSYFWRRSGFVGGRDCDWSILYFVVIIFLIISVPVCGIIFILRGGCGRFCCGGGWRGVAGKTRAAAAGRIRRYRALKEQDDQLVANNKSKVLNLKAFRNRRNGHIARPIVSDTDDLSSADEEEEETVYDRSRLLPSPSSSSTNHHHHRHHNHNHQLQHQQQQHPEEQEQEEEEHLKKAEPDLPNGSSSILLA